MHYGIVIYGSRGDLQPCLALAVGLSEKGHDVTLLANENFKDFVESCGVRFVALPGNIEEIVHLPEVLGILRSGNMIRFFRELQKITTRLQPVVNERLLHLCAVPEVLVASPLAMIWIYSVAEKLDKKWAIVQLSLPTVPTSEFPFAGLSLFDFPLYNLISHRFIRGLYWKLNKKSVNEHRKLISPPVMRESMIQKISEQRILNLYAFSSSLISRPKDWPMEVDITGFLTLPTIARTSYGFEQRDDKLEEWLQNGESPIYLGFGSIPIPDLAKFAGIVRELLTTTNHRFIFCQGWSQMPDLPIHERIYVVKSVDHEWLFPQCKAAIIHGGIGTLAAVLRAKIPVIVVSIFGDQPLWGKLIELRRLGFHIPFKKVTASKLTDAMEQSLTNEITQNAQRVGGMVGENGVIKTIEKLESYFV
ncbi:MAG TPA: glycosyltransferase [Puia sp.]|nr:glycosyltransferase [Puia sp.]